MTVQEFWNSGISFLNLSAVYYVTQILKCDQISFIVFAIVYFLRKTLLKNRFFLKSMLWSLFIPVLFAGKIKFFYEKPIGIPLFSWWTEICKTCIWINWLYICGIFVYAARLFYKKRNLKKMVAGMDARGHAEGIRPKRVAGNPTPRKDTYPVGAFTVPFFVGYASCIIMVKSSAYHRHKVFSWRYGGNLRLGNDSKK